MGLNDPGMPNVCGAVDGTLIRIYAPSGVEQGYVDRHHNHSINAMVVAGVDYRFYFLSSNWPGGTNDARVLRRSSLFTRFENGYRPFPNAVLLGDSIYPVNQWLVPMRARADGQYTRYYK
jgi:hypothetical protein